MKTNGTKPEKVDDTQNGPLNRTDVDALLWYAERCVGHSRAREMIREARQLEIAFQGALTDE